MTAWRGGSQSDYQADIGRQGETQWITAWALGAGAGQSELRTDIGREVRANRITAMLWGWMWANQITA